MITGFENIATVLAAMEVMPAEDRDLSELLESCGDPAKVAKFTESRDGPDGELQRYVRTSIDRRRRNYWHERLQQLAENYPTVTALLSIDADYPFNLHQCYDRPPVIFVDGTLLPSDSRALAIVGSRASGRDGDYIAHDIAYKLAKLGFAIISGLAQGIDAAAHRGAIAASGRSIAVLAHGIDHSIYPPQNNALAAALRMSGALVSQFKPGAPPSASSFILRNAVISGLARASLLIEGGERSGTRTEGEHA